MSTGDAPVGPVHGRADPTAAAEPDRARRAREAARRALFGDDPATSGDEHDDTDRARGGDGPGDAERRYLDERPPHHDRE